MQRARALRRFRRQDRLELGGDLPVDATATQGKPGDVLRTSQSAAECISGKRFWLEMKLIVVVAVVFEVVLNVELLC